MSDNDEPSDLQGAIRKLTDEYLQELIQQHAVDYGMALGAGSITSDRVAAIRGLPGSPPGVRYSIPWETAPGGPREVPPS